MDLCVAVHGAGGKLGTLICEQAHREQVKVLAIARNTSVPQSDVVIDVSSAEGLSSLLTQMSGQPLLIGTTGELPWKALEAYATQAPVAVVPNFSVGVPLLLDLVQKAVRALPAGWDIEVVEAHHNQKKDAPSGTAKRIVRAIQEAGGGEVPTHALRAGDTFGEHTVWLCGPGERLELKHVATGRKVFAIGALRWARWLRTQDPGLIRP